MASDKHSSLLCIVASKKQCFYIETVNVIKLFFFAGDALTQ
jgi:hypothetical protein